jgi:ATP-dependent RNA helicase SUPV3L1/SUV3
LNTRTPSIRPARAGDDTDPVVAEGSDDASGLIATHLDSVGATLVKANGIVAVSYRGVARAGGMEVPYHLVPPQGTLARSGKWNKLSGPAQLDLVRSRAHAASAGAFNREVCAFVVGAALAASARGLDATRLWAPLDCGHEPAERRFQVVLDRIDAQSRRKLAADAAGRTRASVNLARYPESFRLAASMPRRIIAVLGPTNSGKTHVAMEALQRAGSGVYLAPLRLLALENYERLRDHGVRVSLITGEERRICPGATHVASTVEMLDARARVEIAVIDEVQMLGDLERGNLWRAGRHGLPARFARRTAGNRGARRAPRLPRRNTPAGTQDAVARQFRAGDGAVTVACCRRAHRLLASRRP